MKKIPEFFDKLEDGIRAWFSRRTIIYALVGGTGVVLFWRGIWHTADSLVLWLSGMGLGSFPWWDGPVSTIFGAALLSSIGLMVSTFIGNEIIISGIKREKKIAEKTESELKGEIIEVGHIKGAIKEISDQINKIEKRQ